MGRLQPEAIERVREETARFPQTPTSSTICFRLWCSPGPARSGATCSRSSNHAGRAVRRTRASHDGAAGRAVEAEDRSGSEDPGHLEWWHTTEATAAAELLDGGSTADNPNVDADEMVVEVVRGHLEMHSPSTAAQLADLTGLKTSTMAIGLAALQGEGFAIQGNFTAPDLREPEWSSRRLLARMHAYSRQRRRREIDPVTPEQLVRFWLRWQHVAPGSQVRGRAGLSVVLAQLQGASAAVAGWEPDVLARRVQDYEPRWLDELCLAGELTWLRLSPPSSADPDRRGGAPSKATPVSLVYREDLRWLLAAVRGPESPPVPSRGAVAEVIEAIEQRGACFASELVAHTGRLPSDVEDALWEAVARGLVTSDGFAAIRSVSRGQRGTRRASPAGSRLRKGGRAAGRAAGRWSLVGEPLEVDAGAGSGIDREDLAEALAEQLLARWGVVFYDIAAHEGTAMRWRDLQWALRRMEDRGQIRGGRFVNGFSGEQFALPDAVEGLKAVRRLDAPQRSVTISGVDPLNVTGVILPGERIPARRTETVELPL